MNNVGKAIQEFKTAQAILNSLDRKPIAAPWYTSMEDYDTENSKAARTRYAEYINNRENALSIMASAADQLSATEKQIGTGRVVRLGVENGFKAELVLEILNH